jgi:8-amino-7-oxononanoate synthase
VPSYFQFEARVQRRIRELEAAGLRRRLQPPSGIDLSSNDYLGLANHSLLKRRMADAAIELGCGSTASRLLRGDRTAFSHVEARFAQFKSAEAALYFGSGYVANLAVLTTFMDRHDAVLTDERNHASIIDGIRLSRARRIKFRHCDVDHVSRLLERIPAGVQKFLVTESLFSMDGDFAPLQAYADLCRKTSTVLIVDEAHAVGIYGKSGSGYVEQTGAADDVFMTVNTAGKALGVAGAFAAGPSWAVDYLVQKARPFVFSTAPPPPVAATLDTSLSVIHGEPERRQRLLDRSRLLRGLLAEADVSTGRSESQIIPVLLGENERACAAAAELQRQGFDVRALRPPTVPPGTARLRISVNSELDESTLREFALAVGELAGIGSPSCSKASS